MLTIGGYSIASRINGLHKAAILVGRINTGDTVYQVSHIIREEGYGHDISTGLVPVPGAGNEYIITVGSYGSFSLLCGKTIYVLILFNNDRVSNTRVDTKDQCV